MDDYWFFPTARFASPDDLTALVYDLAWFWKTDPETMKNQPLDVILESEEHAWRISALVGSNNV